jgi:hypothetical protein
MAKKTRAELSTEAVTTNLPDNNQELITPATERTQLASERESTLNYKDDITGTVGQALVVGADGESIEFEDLGGGDVLKTGTIAQNRIAIWNDNDSTLRSDATLTINATTHEILLDQPSNEPRDGDNYNIGGGNILATRGIRNVGFGDDNLNVVTNGSFNTAFGSKALSSNTDGSNNVSVGLNSMFLNTEGNNNTAIGHSALGGNSVGINNTAIGSSSLNNVTGSNNTAIGYLSGSAITTGAKNVIIGSFTGTTGESPTPLYDIRTSSNNIVISDGDGNIRQTFDNSGAATFSSTLTVNGTGGFKASANTYADGSLILTSSAGTDPIYLTSNGGFFALSNGGSADHFLIASTGAATFSGSVSKASGSFKIDHPLESKKDTHHLVHSFVESPQANNIYRGNVQLENGMAEVNLDKVSTMTEGTFVVLNTDIHCYTSNESDWDAVKGSVEGNILKIECQNNESNASINWLVIGERHDKHMLETDWTDDNGKVIVEPIKEWVDPIIEEFYPSEPVVSADGE